MGRLLVGEPGAGQAAPLSYETQVMGRSSHFKTARRAAVESRAQMPLLTLADAELAYGDVPLLDGADLALEQGERIGLIGRNGTGKSSLLGVIAGSVQLDHGDLKRNDGLRIAFVPQEPQLHERETVREALL